MPSSIDGGRPGKSALQESGKESWQSFCLSIARIFAFQVMLALVLSGGFVAYLNWSSRVTYAEFLSAGATLAPSNPSLQSIKSVNPCDHGV